MCLANQRLVRIEVVQQLTRLTAVVKGSGNALENDAVRRRRKPAELDLADQAPIDTGRIRELSAREMSFLSQDP